MSREDAEEFQALMELSRKNLEDIARRQKENDPVEIRTLVVAHHNGEEVKFTLRVWGFIDGRPVSDANDWQAWSDYTDSLYKCHWCLDNKRVYLHGEQNEPDVRRRGPGSPCPKCCPVLTATNFWSECERLPGVEDAGVDVRSLIRGAVSAYLTRTIPPHITKAQYACLLKPVGAVLSLDKRALTVTFQPYTEPPDENAGRLRLVDDQGGDYKRTKANERPGDRG